MLQQFAAQNAAQLHAYQWIETTSTTVQGHAMPAQKFICRFAPDGTLTRTPLDPQQNPGQQMKGGPLMKMMEQKKMGEIKDEMTQVHQVAALYLPLNPEKFQEAMQNNQVNVGRGDPSANAISVSDYAKSGDQLTLNLNPTTQQIQSISVKTSLDTPDDPLTIAMQFSKLEDGTVYPSVTTIQAPSKKISITTLSSDFSKPVQ
ncbi:hypothetical protein [Granulicella sp. S156]|uniref:hypothetical protein n=1 Tax=Granulicella sp. S156 TaxID=1747224 RepID=UPI00131E9BE2|nr:hypothetical protein [Granulicella sp. S156]